MIVNPIQQNSHQKPARPSAPVNGAIFMGLMPENSITIFAENSITFDKLYPFSSIQTQEC